MKNKNILTIAVSLLILNIINLFALYSSLHQAGEFRHRDIFYKQVFWIAIAWIVLFVLWKISYRIYFDLSVVFYFLSIILLIVVILIGKNRMGAQRWLNFGGINFQPSEFAKFAVLLFLSRYFSELNSTAKGFLHQIIIPFAYIVPVFILIFKQPDLGTALVLIFVFFIIAFFKVRKKNLLVFSLIIIFSLPLGWGMLKGYQKKRLSVFLNPNIDPLGAGYTITQSKIAIGSGKIFGKGFLSGTQNQFNFLPERHTDFIFTVVAEEWGLIGSLFLLLIYYFILKKILAIGQTGKDNFSSLVCFGTAGLFFIHIFVNIAMTLGILPVVGIPLLFLSYGGTHLVINFSLVGIVFNIASQQQ